MSMHHNLFLKKQQADLHHKIFGWNWRMEQENQADNSNL